QSNFPLKNGENGINRPQSPSKMRRAYDVARRPSAAPNLPKPKRTRELCKSVSTRYCAKPPFRAVTRYSLLYHSLLHSLVTTHSSGTPHSRTVPSCETDASSPPPGLKRRPVTPALCPLRRASSAPLATSHRWIAPSRLPVASSVLSSLKA